MNRRLSHSIHPAGTSRAIKLLVCLLLLVQVGFGQSQKSKLQKQYKSLLSEIDQIESSIQTTAKEKEQSLHQLMSLSEKINTRESVIDNLNRQVGITDRQIAETKEQISTLESEIAELKSDYAEMLVHSYKNSHFSTDLIFLLSAQSFNEAWQRFKYVRRIHEYQKEQALTIERNIELHKTRVETLEQSKEEKKRLLNEQESHKYLLLAEKNQKNQLVDKLTGDERRMRSQIKQKNDLAKKLDQQIQTIILQEIKLAQEKARKKQQNQASKTPVNHKLSGEFVANKGKLPWPVEKGHIISRFGRYSHPQFKNLTIENNGIDIRCNEKESVKTVFEGDVVSVFYLPGKENSIIIKHGDYFTVYTNVINTTVKPGDKVNLRQQIGTAFTNAKEQLSMVHFELWKGNQKLNPELWLAKAM